MRFALLCLLFLPHIAAAQEAVVLVGENAQELRDAIKEGKVGDASSAFQLKCTDKRCEIIVRNDKSDSEELYLYQSKEARNIYQALQTPEHETRVGKMKVLNAAGERLLIVCSFNPAPETEQYSCTIKLTE